MQQPHKTVLPQQFMGWLGRLIWRGGGAVSKRTKYTFLVEISFDAPFDDEEQKRYICASMEEGLSLLWHDYMVNEAVAPQKPGRTCVRIAKATPGPVR